MDSFLKRNRNNADNSSAAPNSPNKRIKMDVCPHSERCYRKNPHHFKEFSHPHLVKFIEMGDSLNIPDNLPQPKSVYLEQIAILKPLMGKAGTVTPKDSDAGPSSSKKFSSKGKATVYTGSTDKTSRNKSMLEKLEQAVPYNLFFTTIDKAPETENQANAVTFTDLICPSLGDLKSSLQINFMIDIDWLLRQYKARNLHTKPLTIVYGDDWPDMTTFIDKFCPNVTYKYFKMKDPFGCHHSKIGIYVYTNQSIRVVVSTANLYFEDWNHYNQGLWMSPACSPLPDTSSDSEGESPTNFKANLLSYLKSYNLPCLKEYIDYVRRADFSNVRVFFIYSAPGRQYPKRAGSHIHQIGDLLSQHCTLPEKTTAECEGPLSWGIIGQASSIGSMGKSPAEWLRGTLLRSLASHSKAPKPLNSQATLNLVYPSVDNVMTGYYGHESGGCLPYSKATNEKQKWLQKYLHQWKAESYGRTRAMPHIKSYCRVSPCLSKLAYFLLTSANLSKSAWGDAIKKDGAVYVRSYEAGVLFLPRFFNENYFEIQRTSLNKNEKLFPFMYDLPLVAYKSDDYPWCN